MHPDYLPKSPEGKRYRLIEECAEVIKECSKIGRFGFDSRHPDGGPTNIEALVAELDDLQHAINEWRNDPYVQHCLRTVKNAPE